MKVQKVETVSYVDTYKITTLPIDSVDCIRITTSNGVKFDIELFETKNGTLTITSWEPKAHH